MKVVGLGYLEVAYRRKVYFVERYRHLLSERVDGKPRWSPVQARRLVAVEAGLKSDKQIKTWDRQLKPGGDCRDAVPKWRTGRGENPSIPKQLQAWLLDAYAKSMNLTTAQLDSMIVGPYYKEHPGEKRPHLTTIHRFVKQRCPELIRCLARDGKTAFETKYLARVLRNISALKVNEVWCADHRLLDLMVLVPDGLGTGWPSSVRKMFCSCGSGKARGECCSVRRLWATVIVDVASAAIVAWRLSVIPSAAVVCHALYEAMMGFGVPSHLIFDNGKEFTAGRLRAHPLKGSIEEPKPSDVEGSRTWPAQATAEVVNSTVWQTLGVQLHLALPKHPQSKIVEAFFSAWSKSNENNLPGYTGRAPARRPEKLKREIEEAALLTVPNVLPILAGQLDQWNGEHITERRRKPPLDFYKDFIPRRVDGRTLAFLLQAEVKRTVKNGRLILKAGEREHLYIDNKLVRYGGAKLTIRWDPSAPQKAYAYCPDGEVLALEETPLADYTSYGETNLVAQRANRALRAYVYEWIVAHKGICPLELLDPTGAHAVVAERVAETRKLERARLALPAAEKAAARQLAAGEAAARRKTEGEVSDPDFGEHLCDRFKWNIYTRIKEEMDLSCEPRPDGRLPLRRLWHDMVSVEEVVKRKLREPLDEEAARAWARMSLCTTQGRSLLLSKRFERHDEISALASLVPDGPVLDELVKESSGGAVSVCVGECLALAAETFTFKGVVWHVAVDRALNIVAQLRSAWETGAFAGAARAELEALDALAVLGLANITLQEALAAAQASGAGVPELEMEGGYAGSEVAAVG